MPGGRKSGRASEGWIVVSFSGTKTLGTMKKYRRKKEKERKGKKRSTREKVTSS